MAEKTLSTGIAPSVNVDDRAHEPAERSDFDSLVRRHVGHVSHDLDDESMDRLERVAKIMASGRSSLPKHLHDSMGDCFAIAMLAHRIKCDPFALAQRSFVVNGRLGLEAPAVIAITNSCGDLSDRLKFDWFGSWDGVKGKTDESQDRGVVVSATLVGEDAPRTLRLTMADVGRVRNSPLWESNPRQQLAYRAASYWSRLNAPDATLGIRGVDELEDFVVTSDPVIKNQRRTTTATELLSRSPDATKNDDVDGDRDAQKKAIASLEAVAKSEGYEAAKKAWKKLPEAMRVKIGDAERDRVSRIGKDADEARAKAHKVDQDTGEINMAYEFEEAIRLASSADSAASTLDEARTELGAESSGYASVLALYKERFSVA